MTIYFIFGIVIFRPESIFNIFFSQKMLGRFDKQFQQIEICRCYVAKPVANI